MKIIRIVMLFLIFFTFWGVSSAEIEKENIERILPHNTRVESFKYNKDIGLYEVVSEGRIFYLTEDLRHLIIGNIIDLKTLRNLTADRVREIRTVDFESLPKKDAIKVGNGKRGIAVFTDPDCPYCKKLHAELKRLEDVSIFIFLYPVSDEGRKKSIQVWCSEERVKTLDVVLGGGRIGAALCGDHPIDRNLSLGRKLSITGTPTTITDRGEIISGYVKAETLREALNKGAK